MSEKVGTTTQAGFATDVIEASRTTPVLVDFWAAWCGPCKMIAPLLERIAADYGTRARVVKVDTDAEPGLAAGQGIRSLPTLRLFRNGESVAELIGVQPESTIRALIERYLEKPSDRQRAEATRLLEEDRAAEAVAILERVVSEDPASDAARVELIAALIAAGRLTEAREQTEALPLSLLESPELKALEARLAFATALAGAPGAETLRARLAADPADLQARHQLAMREFDQGHAQAALEQWLEILRRDRDFGDGAARRSLLQAFDLLAGREDLVQPYRRQMMALLH